MRNTEYMESCSITQDMTVNLRVSQMEICTNNSIVEQYQASSTVLIAIDTSVIT